MEFLYSHCLNDSYHRSQQTTGRHLEIYINFLAFYRLFIYGRLKSTILPFYTHYRPRLPPYYDSTYTYTYHLHLPPTPTTYTYHLHLLHMLTTHAYTLLSSLLASYSAIYSVYLSCLL